MLNQRDLEMMWVACEEQAFQFSENKSTDPRYKAGDWADLLRKIEEGLGELGAGIPKNLVKKKN